MKNRQEDDAVLRSIRIEKGGVGEGGTVKVSTKFLGALQTYLYICLLTKNWAIAFGSRSRHPGVRQRKLSRTQQAKPALKKHMRIQV